MDMIVEDNWKEIVDTCDEWVKEANVFLGYDTLTFEYCKMSKTGPIVTRFWCVDDFQSGIAYSCRCQHGFLELSYPPTLDDLKNREQRELHVLLGQQGESVAIAEELVSASGRAFVKKLIAERAKYAQLVDFGGTEIDPDKAIPHDLSWRPTYSS